MGKVIKMPSLVIADEQEAENVRHLKALIDKYITVDKIEVINKIKKEQHGSLHR